RVESMNQIHYANGLGVWTTWMHYAVWTSSSRYSAGLKQKLEANPHSRSGRATLDPPDFSKCGNGARETGQPEFALDWTRHSHCLEGQDAKPALADVLDRPLKELLTLTLRLAWHNVSCQFSANGMPGVAALLATPL